MSHRSGRRRARRRTTTYPTSKSWSRRAARAVAYFLTAGPLIPPGRRLDQGVARLGADEAMAHTIPDRIMTA
jgi:hypothetical protein